MIMVTYAVQFFAVIFALAACALMVFAISKGLWKFVPTHLILIAVNTGLFILLGAMR